MTHNFRIGDRVVKARPYSRLKYCCYGGEEEDLPIGSVGTIITLHRDSDEISINFDDQCFACWNCDASELELTDKRFKKRIKLIDIKNLR